MFTWFLTLYCSGLLPFHPIDLHTADVTHVGKWETLPTATPRMLVVTLSLSLMKNSQTIYRLLYNGFTLNASQFIEIVKLSEMSRLYL